MQEPPLTGAINVRAPRYLVARTDCACWRCARATPVIAVALDAAHTLWIDGADRAEAGKVACVWQTAGAWQAAGMTAMLFYVEYLPLGVRRGLQAHSPLYRYAHNRATDGSYWINHCAHCGSAQEDDHLHGEPDVAFMPLSEAAASRIALLPVAEPFAAWAGGYCADPPLLAAMRSIPAGGR